jgi:hypothetical protein
MNPLAIVEIGARLLDKLIPDQEARAKAQTELLRAAQDQDFQLALAQIHVNREEAANASIFVSGWRPAVGWVCVAGLVYNFVVYPFLLWLVAAYEFKFTPPPILHDTLMELVLGMLGLGALRTVEKWKGVAR